MSKNTDKSKLELAAMEAVSNANAGPKQKLLSDEEREFTVDKKKYRFINVPAIFWTGNKTPIEKIMKDQKILEALVENDSALIKKVI